MLKGGLASGEIDRETVLTLTEPGGTPETAKRVTVLEPVLTMYSIAVELSDWTGWTENWLPFGPNETKSRFDAPDTISLLLMTQYCAPLAP